MNGIQKVVGSNPICSRELSTRIDTGTTKVLVFMRVLQTMEDTVMARKRIRIYDRTQFNDIRYRGPFSYRHLMIFGWICISLFIMSAMISFGIRLDPKQPEWVYALGEVSEYGSNFALPLFLFANFAVILDRKFTYKTQLLKFGGLSAIVVLLYILVKEHYFVGIATVALDDHAAAETLANQLLLDLSLNGKLSFNLFIDMFLCTLLMFFLNYIPKSVFTGKKLIVFRLFALFPILYELGCLAIRVYTALGMLKPHFMVYPFLTTKPLMSFVLFVVLALHIKLQERKFLKHGKTVRDYERYTQTNSHSLHFSIFSSVMILITAIIDIILNIVGAALFMASSMSAEAVSQAAEITKEAAEGALKAVDAWGIGKHTSMLMIIPIILLFSYTRNHKDTRLDMAIPVGGAILAAFTFLETLYWGIVMNLPIIMRQIQQMAEELLSSGLS